MSPCSLEQSPLLSLGGLSLEPVGKGGSEVSLDPRDPWFLGGGVRTGGGDLRQSLGSGHLKEAGKEGGGGGRGGV